MKLLFLLLPISIVAQTYPSVEEFNPPLVWSTNNGSGIQNYGSSENYLTTNIGNTPYPDSTTISMVSPTVSYSNCLSNLSISFPISGRIEYSWDFLYFDYSTNGGSSWTNLGTFTGYQNNTYTFNVPNTANKFRFRLITDNSVNTYTSFGSTYVYYYDIARFTINCSAVLPVQFVYFKVSQKNNYNLLTWRTESEDGSDYFKIYRSEDMQNWEIIDSIQAKGICLDVSNYSCRDFGYSNKINYYKLEEVDKNGSRFILDIISIDNTSPVKEIVTVTNLLGQVLQQPYSGFVIITYSDNSQIKTYYE